MQCFVLKSDSQLANTDQQREVGIGRGSESWSVAGAEEGQGQEKVDPFEYRFGK